MSTPSRISIPRVLLGGLVAGLISNVSGILIGILVLHEEAAAMIAALKSPPSPLQMFVQHVSMRFAFGFFVVWLYAAIRPRFGPGPATALRAALFVYLAAYASTALLFLEIEVYSPASTAIVLVWSLAEVVLMAMAGAWLYRERS